MARATPWDNIQKPNADYNVRLISGAAGVPMYWGRNTEGRCLLIIELGGNYREAFRAANISVRGVRVDLRIPDSTKRQSLVLALEQEVDSDIFQAMCTTLVDALSPIAEPATAFSITVTHLKRWKVFMAGKKSRLLSPQEVIGLFGELLFFKRLYSKHFGVGEALGAWVGPDGAQQDFIISNTAFEIKSVSGKTRNTISISSEDQLESVCSRLFIILNKLSEVPDSDRAVSLNELVSGIERDLSNPDHFGQFENRLLAYGYVPLADYDVPKLLSTSQKAFRIAEDFPKLIRSKLSHGIVRVRYEIELEEILPFETSIDEAMEF